MQLITIERELHVWVAVRGTNPIAYLLTEGAWVRVPKYCDNQNRTNTVRKSTLPHYQISKFDVNRVNIDLQDTAF
jgi:hypothetical protein